VVFTFLLGKNKKIKLVNFFLHFHNDKILSILIQIRALTMYDGSTVAGIGSAKNNTGRGTEEGTDGEAKTRNLEPM
jgi:hypothetical protein